MSDKVTAALYAPHRRHRKPVGIRAGAGRDRRGERLRAAAFRPVTGIDRAGEGYRLHTPQGEFLRHAIL